ncbi:MAG: class I SAM-dependent methyltransferase [Microscillaceae bacterium]|nr:class I SAM-dependent methyltransferase [Microscillaceae bacterium]MDW8461478.1 class I SAM-dependent methyltransferase [Cytophagales bacterium]
MHIPIATPVFWKEYELIDCGNFEKLERFGKNITLRPEPQALWERSLSAKAWQELAHATFRREKNNPEKGIWETKKSFTSKWILPYQSPQLNLIFKLSLSSFKHVGIFPEQAYNWEFIAEQVKNLPPKPKVLNMFAYTGGASLAAKQAGAEVTHLDSVKQVNLWARENMELSHLANIRWITEDALSFAKRELRRGNQYQAIILDPPAYGRGTNGEKWILEDNLLELLKICQQLLAPRQSFLVINLYSLGFSVLILENLLKAIFPIAKTLELAELYILDRHQKKLPLGISGRVIL